MRDQDIISEIKHYMRGSQNPDFVGYRTQTEGRDMKDGSRFIWDMRRTCKIGNFYNSTVLDVGCGGGWQAFAISRIGNNKVIASDILPSMIDAVADCVRHMKNIDLPCNIQPMLGDICQLDLPPNSVDGIYSLESIEHVHDIDKMFDRCADILKPGGRVIVGNDSNILARGLRDETVSMWHQRENSWEWSDYLRSLRPIEHKEAEPFRLTREKIVRAANPSLDEKAVALIVAATPGLLKSDIQHIATTYTAATVLPKVPAYDWCRNPETGEYAERLLDPFNLAKRLTQRGIAAKVLHGFRRFPLNFLNSVPVKTINKILFNVRPGFLVVGEKLSPHGVKY